MFKIRSRKPAPPTALTPIICEAIREKRVARCVYEDGETRTVEPHCHGYSRDGAELVSAYQVAGPSEAGWKMFDVKKLLRFEMTAEKFATRADFNAASPGMKRVHCR